MFSIEEFPEEPQPPPLPGPCHRDPPESPWGGSSGSSPAATPTEGGGGGSGGGDPPPTFRGRSRSAPPVLWAARKYGRELRRMSDEFQLLKSHVVPQQKWGTAVSSVISDLRSAGAARRTHAAASLFLWGLGSMFEPKGYTLPDRRCRVYPMKTTNPTVSSQWSSIAKRVDDTILTGQP
ncbi:bcl2-associated agonist of cell death [Gallus gallus]|uniref:bcl2-associated agonist of cell death n=1 Tax=Gallus gallus TaxID=9031 RepID=UPI001F0112A3|nr:bcl2-associated agonist of cell death [Gallus gallus]